MTVKKHILIALISIAFYSCGKYEQTEENNVITEETNGIKQLVVNDLQKILDSTLVEGAVLILDTKNDIFYSNNFDWANQGKLPASTFKIPNSIIALETGVVEDDSTVFKWNGQKRRLKVWEQDLTFRDALHVSCVPCYQQIARKVGVKTMHEKLEKLAYPGMHVDATNLDMFWLEGNSAISQFQQIDFLQRFHSNKLHISARTKNIMKRMLIMDENNQYRLSGKTGWSVSNGNNNGWFIGYIEKENSVYYFATNISPKAEFNMKMFAMIRKEITMKALKRLEII